ncbi:MAG: type VII toxin-antitoxin system HepT family RNase toxin [Desulfohalobiaceae bacterium]
MINHDVLLRLLSSIESYVSDLRNAQDLNYSNFMSDIRAQRFVERTLQIAVEACLDTMHHIISDQKWREPDSYADAFMVLAQNHVLSLEQARRFSLMARFRNKLVHHYEKVDPEQVFTIFEKHLNDFDEFVASIRSWLQQSK